MISLSAFIKDVRRIICPLVNFNRSSIVGHQIDLCFGRSMTCLFVINDRGCDPRLLSVLRPSPCVSSSSLSQTEAGPGPVSGQGRAASPLLASHWSAGAKSWPLIGEERPMVTDAGQGQAGATDPHCKGQAEPPGPGRARDSEQLTLTDSLVQPVTAQPTHISTTGK